MINQHVLPDVNVNYNFFNNVRFGNEVWWFLKMVHQVISGEFFFDRLRELFGDQVVALNHDPE